jgi:hypothetical protein
MKHLIFLLFSVGTLASAHAQNDRAYFKSGLEAPTLIRCGLKLAIGKIKSRGVEGRIRISGQINYQEMHRSFSLENFEDNRVARTYVDFDGHVGTIPVKGSVVLFAQKKLDQLGRPIGGVICKLSNYDQLRTKSQRRFILIDKNSGMEID